MIPRRSHPVQRFSPFILFFGKPGRADGAILIIIALRWITKITSHFIFFIIFCGEGKVSDFLSGVSVIFQIVVVEIELALVNGKKPRCYQPAGSVAWSQRRVP